MKIQRNKLTGGFYAVVRKGQSYYCADLSFTMDHGPETMIFPCDETGKILSYEEVFVNWPGEVTEGALKKDIESFLTE